MKFDKDVFISYAHIDDKPLDEGAKGWISDFHTLLETRLEQTIGHEILIWRDERLTGNDVFAKEIESQLPTLKLMVSIITPRYLDSDWCKRELGAFYKAALANGGVQIGNKSRIFKIVKTPVDDETIRQLPSDIHEVFDTILDYKFYIHESSTGKFRELSRSSWVDNRIRQEYMNKLDDVVQDIANLIKLLNKGEPLAEKRKIYIAETSFDMQVYRDNLIRELEEADFMIVPDKNLPYIADRFRSDVSDYLDQSILSVHMISSSNYAMQPEGSDKSIVILQNEIAADKSGSGDLKRLIWVPPVAPENINHENLFARQSQFIQELKSNLELQKGADILVGPLEEFKQAIFDTLKRIADEEKKKNQESEEVIETEGAPVPEDSIKLIYLICEQRDLDDIIPIEDCLTDSGFEILLPLFDGDNAQLRQVHLENLKICDAVLIYYGNGNYRWVSSMKSDLLRLPAFGRTKPLLSKTIYIAAPSDADKEKFRSNDAEVIRATNGFQTDQLKGFIEKIK